MTALRAYPSIYLASFLRKCCVSMDLAQVAFAQVLHSKDYVPSILDGVYEINDIWLD